MIRVERLTKSFGDLRAVDDLSFSVAPGEVLGLLGPNGAGKTTTLSMIAGLLRPDRGIVHIGDDDLWRAPAMAKRRIGLAPQEIALYEYVSARANLLFFGGLYELPRSRLRERADQLLEWMELSDRADQPVGDFSGGMKRRLNLITALVHDPKAVLLDEPTVGIDPQARNHILEAVREIARQGAAVIYTSHQLSEVESVCDRIMIMDHGRLLEEGSMDQLTKLVENRRLVDIQGGFTAEQIRNAAALHPSAAPVRVEDGSALFQLEGGDEEASSLLRTLLQEDILVSSFALEKPTLENIFLQLTGKVLRD